MRRPQKCLTFPLLDVEWPNPSPRCFCHPCPLSETTLVAFRGQHRKYIWGSERLDEVVSIQLLLGTEGRSPKQIKAQRGGAVSVFQDLQTIWRRQWQPTPVLLPGKSHGQRSLVGCSPWGREESDTTERLHFHFALSCIGEGNGNPLQLFLPGESQGWGSLVGCRLWGRTESDTTEVT